MRHQQDSMDVNGIQEFFLLDFVLLSKFLTHQHVLRLFTYQVLRVVALSYPTLVPAYWERVSVLVYKLLQSAVVEVSPTTWKASVRESVGFIGDKVLIAAIKAGYQITTFYIFEIHLLYSLASLEQGHSMLIGSMLRFSFDFVCSWKESSLTAKPFEQCLWAAFTIRTYTGLYVGFGWMPSRKIWI